MHGSSRTIPFRSKQSVHESSRTLIFRNCSRKRCRGRTILSWSFRDAWELKLWKLRFSGGNLNGSEPKLNRHCWNDIHEAAAKNPSLGNEWNVLFHSRAIAKMENMGAYLALPKTCLRTPPSSPFRLNMTSCASKSSRHPRIEPPCHDGKSCGIDFALCQINRRHPSNAIEYGSSPMPYPSYNFIPGLNSWSLCRLHTFVGQLTWLRKFESLVAQPICMTPGVMIRAS